ncbi:MAG: phosphatidate cytidylyltransferase, partial [Candidatus Omnitrophica bacterium]|nr:phosphatidate cytidylyltransferase [Candidatus Omnitrophota bacterium]
KKYGGFVPDLEPFLIVIVSLFVFVLQFTRKDNSSVLTATSITLLGILYISWFFSFIIRLKYLPGGAYFVAYLLLVTKVGDIGAYLVGNIAGRHSLIPRISPKKTVEGTIGGFACSITTAFLARGLLPNPSVVDII